MNAITVVGYAALFQTELGNGWGASTFKSSHEPLLDALIHKNDSVTLGTTTWLVRTADATVPAQAGDYIVHYSNDTYAVLDKASLIDKLTNTDVLHKTHHRALTIRGDALRAGPSAWGMEQGLSPEEAFIQLFSRLFLTDTTQAYHPLNMYSLEGRVYISIEEWGIPNDSGIGEGIVVSAKTLQQWAYLEQ